MAGLRIEHPIKLVSDGDKLTLSEIRSSSTDSGYVKCTHTPFAILPLSLG